MDIDYDKFKTLLSKQKINVHIGRDWVDERDKPSFTSPLLLNSNIKPKKLLKFLKDSTNLDVTITNRKPEKWRVYYDGTIKNQNGETLQFENVDNGFCVNIG